MRRIGLIADPHYPRIPNIQPNTVIRVEGVVEVVMIGVNREHDEGRSIFGGGFRGSRKSGDC